MIDDVLFPTQHPLALFPSRSLKRYMLHQPDLTLFTQLLKATALFDCVEDPLLCGNSDACPGGVPWASRTVFAPVDSAFSKLSSQLLAWLFAPANHALVRYILLVSSWLRLQRMRGV